MPICELAHPGVADARAVGYRQPIALPGHQKVEDNAVEVFGHARRIAISCYSVKQHIAIGRRDTATVKNRGINFVLADNLHRLMKAQKHTQATLGAAAGMGQTTVGLYLHPDRRKESVSAKPPSGKLADVERLATALKVELWELLMPPITMESREALESSASRLSLAALGIAHYFDLVVPKHQALQAKAYNVVKAAIDAIPVAPTIERAKGQDLILIQETPTE